MLSRYCVIRQDLSLAAYKQFERKPLDSSTLEKIAIQLGCVDLRTARRHMKRIKQKLQDIQKTICEFLSCKFVSIPDSKPDTSLSQATDICITGLSEYFTQTYGKVIPEEFFEVLRILNYLDHHENFSTTFVCQIPSFQDTS